MQKGNYQRPADAHFTCQSFLTAYPKGVSSFSMPHVRMRALHREVPDVRVPPPNQPKTIHREQNLLMHEHCQTVQIQAMILSKHP